MMQSVNNRNNFRILLQPLFLLLGDECPESFNIDYWAPLCVAGQMEPPHTDFSEVTAHAPLINSDSQKCMILLDIPRVILIKVRSEPDTLVRKQAIRLQHYSYRWWCNPPARPLPPGCFRCLPTRPCPADTWPRCLRVFEKRVGMAN